MAKLLHPTDLLNRLQARTPLLWLNPHLGEALPPDAPHPVLIEDAEQRIRRHEPLLKRLFPELRETGGRIESSLMPADALQLALGHVSDRDAWFVKRDDSLPVAGSIKARGGFHEVLAVAERIARDYGEMSANDPVDYLLSENTKRLFANHTIAVGSTGNLGLSIGVLAAALGFDAVVHMSRDAKHWKKQRLVSRGVRVIEHDGDYAKAVDAGRQAAQSNSRCHFVDDERSALLFFGYAAAARHLAVQLEQAGRVVDEAHPLFVTIPCGVGGAPGGITYGLKALFGQHVHCFFAEPVASPCMLVQLAAVHDEPLSVYDIGLDNRTEADGLAVGQASRFVSPLMKAQLSGIFTVPDDTLYQHLRIARTSLGIALEPSAAAAIGGPGWLANSPDGKRYIQSHAPSYAQSTHVIWTTGGSLVPAEEYARYARVAA
ncbi:D-serine ammonia-lyase [Paraburkholderia dilworthii]|uniref:Probable D-serine dehydratase n=1 Tax=Paraburkholderia dilworthii TaxID=948106 RepID=A0ABW9DDW5_9BURK